MFSNVIQHTPFTTQAAERFFSEKIFGDFFQNDSSFLSTLRALMYGRIGDEGLYLAFDQSTYSKRALEDISAKDAIGAIYHGMQERTLTVHNFNSYDSADNDAWMDLVDEHFSIAHTGYTRIEKVTQFFRKKLRVSCFVNETKKASVLFVSNMDMRAQHYIQCGIPAYLPWYFTDGEGGFSEIEMALIASFRERRADKYLECLDQMIGQYDIRTENIRALLRDFESRYEQKQITSTQRQIDRLSNQLASLQESIAQALREKRDFDIRLIGLQERIRQKSAGNSEIMEYFLCNKDVELVSVNDDRLRFVAKGYLEYFDEEMAASSIDNENSYIYYANPGRRQDHPISNEQMAKLMKAIFLEQRIRVRSCAMYDLVLDSRVDPIQHGSYGNEYRTYLPNPHTDHYACMGNYLSLINELIIGGNYIGAIEQCLASCRSLNFGDSTVMCRFMETMYGVGERNSRCLEMPDGSVVRPWEAIERLEKEENENG